MKPAICYLLRPVEVESWSTQSFFSVPRIDRDSYTRTWGDDEKAGGYIRPTTATILIDKHVRVSKLREAPKGLITPAEYEFEDHFFGVEPALEQILREPYRAELKLAQERTKASESDHACTLALVQAFVTAPLWKRMWLAVRGRIQ